MSATQFCQSWVIATGDGDSTVGPKVKDLRHRIKHFRAAIRVTDWGEPPLTWREHLERLVTDSPLQFIRHFIARRHVERIPEKEHFRERRAGNTYARRDRAWRYGRFLSDRGLATYDLLRSHGVTRRELRLAVCCRFITQEGEIRINWLKERILQMVSVSFAVFVFVSWIDLLIQLDANPSSLFVKMTFAGMMLMISVVAVYPIVLLGATPLQIAQRIWDIQNNSSADLTNRCD